MTRHWLTYGCHYQALSSSPRTKISFLFGGIGDARNLFQTVIKIAEQDRKTKEQERKHYHFTIVDLKAPAIARNLVLLMLLDGLAQLADAAEMRSSKLLLCVFYTQLSTIMPQSVYNTLQETLAQAETALKEGSLPSYISK